MLKAPGESILPHFSRNYCAPTLLCLLYFLYLRCLFSPRGLPALACFACLFVLARLARLAGLARLVSKHCFAIWNDYHRKCFLIRLSNLFLGFVFKSCFQHSLSNAFKTRCSFTSFEGTTVELKAPGEDGHVVFFGWRTGRLWKLFLKGVFGLMLVVHGQGVTNESFQNRGDAAFLNLFFTSPSQGMFAP